MRSIGEGAVKRNLGPDPSMGRKVELLRRLVSMRQENARRKDPGAIRRDPKATTNPPQRGGYGERRPMMPGKPTRLPRYDRMP